jgi:hypothetical protein
LYVNTSFKSLKKKDSVMSHGCVTNMGAAVVVVVVIVVAAVGGSCSGGGRGGGSCRAIDDGGSCSGRRGCVVLVDVGSK